MCCYSQFAGTHVQHRSRNTIKHHIINMIDKTSFAIWLTFINK
ncbi:hypothetical protein HMPREF0880_01690 [Yokenella regensburgei ATCC 43003]|nr:hypothetical protein HMPREF0880_01690 [Yokenella regensburgei ATCC 43003]